MKKDYLGFIITIIIALIFIVSIIILGNNNELKTENEPTEIQKNTQQSTQEIPAEEPKLTKEECYQIEKELWSRNRERFADNSKYINENYDRYNISCNSYSAQIGNWKPDKNWFLHKNYEDLAYDYYRKKDYSNATLYYDKSIQTYYKSNTKRISADTSYHYGGMSYYYLKNFDKAEQYLTNAPQEILEVSETLSEIYLHNGDIKNAAIYASQSIYIINEKISYIEEKQSKSQVDYENIAELEFQKMHYAEILNMYEHY